MRNRMDVIDDLIDAFHETLPDFYEQSSWGTFGDTQEVDYRIYEIEYLNLHQAERQLKVELDFERNILIYSAFGIPLKTEVPFQSLIKNYE